MLEKEVVLTRMDQDMALRGFADSTRSNYQRNARKYLEYSGGKTDAETIREFLSHLLDSGLAPGSVNMYNAAIRFLLEVTMDVAVNHKRVPRLRETRKLPRVLSKDDIRRIFARVENLQHRALLMTIYGGGLRVSEACDLRVRDIDSASMRIFVEDGKRGKDRYTLLSGVNLDILREYWRAYRPRHPEGWLFLNADGSRSFCKRVIQNAFAQAHWEAGIQKKATVHTLRSSFATHLLEDGVDFFTVKRLLGHSDMSSTTRYLGVTESSCNLKRPLDSMPKKRGRKPKTGMTHG